MRDLLSNTPNCYVLCGRNFADIYLEGMRDRSMQSGTELARENPANWLVNSRKTRQTGFSGFDHAITGAIYFNFHKGKKSRLSIAQITDQFKFFQFTVRFLSRNDVEKKFKQKFVFGTWIQLTKWRKQLITSRINPTATLSTDQSNRSPGFFLNFQLTNSTTWQWRWLPHRLSKTSVTNNSSSQDANHPDDLCQSKFASNSSLARCEKTCLTDRSSRLQIPRDICTRFGRYFYSPKCSLIINGYIKRCT